MNNVRLTRSRMSPCSALQLYLVNHYADVSKRDGQKRTALHYASESGHLKVVELLLSNGTKIDAED